MVDIPSAVNDLLDPATWLRHIRRRGLLFHFGGISGSSPISLQRLEAITLRRGVSRIRRGRWRQLSLLMGGFVDSLVVI